MKVLFLGSSHFSKVVLEKMLEKGVNVVGVITQPDKPSGRGYKMSETEVKKYAKTIGINVYTFDKVRNHIEEIKAIDYDVALVASFGQILPEEFLNHRLTLNVHPSLLPKYRGATPLQTALLNGEGGRKTASRSAFTPVIPACPAAGSPGSIPTPAQCRHPNISIDDLRPRLQKSDQSPFS